MQIPQSKGKVIIAGAGPGAPDLITIKLRNALPTADVIIVDRLVNPLIIDRYATNQAIIIEAGKHGYNNASISQVEISDLIVHHAKAGKTVLRLKGGDVAFFSNVLDELIILRKNNIQFEIIPGITAASGASAYAGIPLTARGYAQGVQFITLNPTSDFNDEKWISLANSEDTLVFYMTARNIDFLAEKFLQFSPNPKTSMAIIEQATTEHQQIHITTIRDFKKHFGSIEFSSPSLIIVGSVVNLHKEFNWFDANAEGSVFKELIAEENTH